MAGVAYVEVVVHKLGGELLRFSADSTWTVDRIKEHVELVSGIPKLEQRLVSGTQILSDRDTIASMGAQVCRGLLTLTLIRRTPKQMHWLKQIQERPRAYANAPEEIREDREIAYLACQGFTPSVSHIPPVLLEDRAFVLELLRLANTSPIFRRLTPQLQCDREVAFAAFDNTELIGFRNELLAYVDPGLRGDRDFLRVLLLKTCISLGNMHIPAEVRYEFSADRDLVVTALQKSGFELEYAAPAFRDDESIVKLALQKSIMAVQFASERLRNDRAFMLAAIEKSFLALRYASDELRDDRQFVQVAIGSSYQALGLASQRLRNDRYVVLTAIGKSHRALKFASKRLQADVKIVAAAASRRTSGRVPFHAARHLRQNAEVQKAVIAGQRTASSTIRAQAKAASKAIARSKRSIAATCRAEARAKPKSGRGKRAVVKTPKLKPVIKKPAKAL